VAHPGRSREQIRQTVDSVLEGRNSQRLIGDLILRLRLGAEPG